MPASARAFAGLFRPDPACPFDVRRCATARQAWAAAATRRAMRILLAAAVVVPLTILGAGAWLSWRSAWEGAAAELSQTADAVAEYALRVLEGQRLLADRLNDNLRGLSDAAIRDAEHRLHGQFRSAVSGMPQALDAHVLAADASVLVSSVVYPVNRRLNLSEREFFSRLKDDDAPPVAISPVYASRVDGTLFFAVSRRRTGTGNVLAAPGGFDGVVSVSLSPGGLSEGFGRLAPRSDDVIALMRNDGHVLASRPGSDRPLPPLGPGSMFRRETAQAGDQAIAYGESGLDGVPRLTAYRRVPGYPVWVVAARPRAAILADWRGSVLQQLAFGLPATLALIGTAFLALRRTRDADRAHAAFLEEARRREAAEAMRASEAWFRETADHAPVLMWVSEPDGTCTWFNLPWLEFTGRSLAQELRTGWADRIHAEDRAGREEVLAGCLARPARFQTEYRLRHADGTWRWVLETGVPRLTAAGRCLGLIGSCVDITDRREAEERQQLLMREVDHRAKNALAVVQAALRLTRAPDQASFVRAVQGRVDALARTQTLLAKGRWAGADLHSLLRGELAAFAADAGDAPRTELAGPPVLLPPGVAQPLSMVAHELATNAVKYGALSRPGGRVLIAWSLGADHGLRLRWTEVGGPPAARPTRRGFGSQVIERTVRGQLGGTVEQEWAPSGLVCTVTLALARPKRPDGCRHVTADGAGLWGQARAARDTARDAA